MRLHLFSDIHLEFADLRVPPLRADVTIAAGDVGVGTQALPWLTALGRPVVYIAGNHEYYGGVLETVAAELAQSCASGPIYFLDNGATIIDGVRFLGTTLWSDFGGANPTLMAQAEAAMNDYVQIRTGAGRTLTPADTLQLQRNAAVWLEHALAEPHAGPTVVVTHHAPSARSWPYAPDPLYVGAYCNALDPLIASSGAALWIHGHVHSCSDYRVGATRVLCNPRGYAGIQVVNEFDPGLVVDL